MQSKLYQTAAITTLLLAGLGGAHAASGTQNDALGINDAGISLTQAISAAEQHVGGKASKAEYEQEKGRSAFEVEVVKGTAVTDVVVDPANGAILSAKADKADQGDEDHEEHGDRRGESEQEDD
ncbi:MAG: PepSY domain-containing protein [Thiohalocapsa sp.]|uniref:PepSY domain-containing protein n=1 Tax=Thiohalocapsa sp. TaxID=2497641 RepID=UPI0025D724E0|nr:PepSY domain-containing protein [Thiohalocapsa sp.]MCG6942522.1 PepSY domain-containing protein [Thiohalocapsa sp.]